MNFHISRWSPLRPQFSSSSLRSPTSRHHDPTGTNHDTVTTHATSPSSVTIEVDGVDTSDDDLTNLKRHRHHNTGLENNSSDKHHVNQDDDTTESESDISADDITQDSRDVLVQRLTDLADKLSESNVRNSSIEALHKQVDEMERVLRGASRTRSASRHSRASSRRARSLRPGSRPRSLQFAAPATAGAGSGAVMNGELSPRGRENALGIMGATPMSPSWFVSHFQRPPSIYFQDKDREGVMSPTAGVSKQPDVPSSSPSPSPSPRLNDLESKREASPRISHQQDSEAPPTKQQQQQPQQQEGARTHTSPHPEIPSEVTEVVREAEKMCAEMATIIENLQSRRQESDVIPSLFDSLGEREKTNTHFENLQHAISPSLSSPFFPVCPLIIFHHKPLAHLNESHN